MLNKGSNLLRKALLKTGNLPAIMSLIVHLQQQLLFWDGLQMEEGNGVC